MAVQLGFPDKYYICARYGTEVLLNDASISDSDKLLIYALGQQAEYGENKTPKPSIFDTVARAKWNAWAELGKRSPFEAMFMYTQAVDELAPEWWKWPPLKLVEGADDGADDDGVPPPAAPPGPPLLVRVASFAASFAALPESDAERAERLRWRAARASASAASALAEATARQS